MGASNPQTKHILLTPKIHTYGLDVTPDVNINAGGNILNATGAAYVNGDFLYAVQVSATEWIVLG